MEIVNTGGRTGGAVRRFFDGRQQLATIKLSTNNQLATGEEERLEREGGRLETEE